MTIQETQNEIIEEFTLFDDWMDRYNHLIDLGKKIPEINPKYKDKDHLIEGCQSRVWLHAAMEGDKVKFTADSDAIITKGIAALLVRVLSGHTPDDILNAEMTFIDAIGLRQNLSPTRSNGLLSMLKQMKLYAMAFKHTKAKE